MGRRRVLVPWLAAGLVVALGLFPGSAAVAATDTLAEFGVTEDPCVDRPPTELDRRSDWRCVGLATYNTFGQPTMGRLTDDEALRLNVTRPTSYELGVAVSPDGRLYRQTARSPVGLRDVRSHNPTPPDGDPEGPPQPPRTGDLSPETIFGPDDRVIRLSTTSYPWRSIGSILPPGSPASNCSGALIGPRHFLTAGHCLHTGGTGVGTGWYPNLKVGPGQRGIGVFPNGLKNHAWYFSVSGWYDHGDPAFDYAMIVLQDRSDTAHLGWLGWTTSGQTGEHWTFGYPGWSHQCAASPSADGECDNYQYGDDNTASPVLIHQIGTEADVQSGQSGSPIYKWNNGDRRVIAVMAYHGNWGTRVTAARSDNFCEWIHAFPSAFNSHPCQ